VPDELGYQQNSAIPGWAQMLSEIHEANPDLAWPKSIDLYDRMRREDAQVGSVLRAVTLPIRSATYAIDPAGAAPEVVEHIATDLGLPVKGQPIAPALRTRGRFSWTEHLRLALLELVYGHSFFEQVYRYDGNRMRLAKLAWRPPRTIVGIDVAKDGGLEAIRQAAKTGGGDIVIPVDRLVAYVNDREGANWVGASVLRTAYKNWLLKDRELRAQALTIDRNGLGVPIYEGAPVPDTADETERAAWIKSERESGLNVAKNFRAGESAGASLTPGAKLTLTGVTGNLPETDKPIRYQDEQIARAVLAHFLNLGTETGSWALGSTFANFFTDSLNGVAAHIVDVTQQHVVEDLVDLNYGPTVPAPRIVFEPIGSEHPATAEAIKALLESKAITRDDALEAHMRAAYSLPVRDTDGGAASEVDAQAARAAVEAVQKVYLGVGVVLSVEEARELVRRAGADIAGALPAAPPTPEEPNA